MTSAWYDLDEEEPRAAEIVPRAPDPLEGVPHGKWLLSKQRKIFLESSKMLEDALRAQEIDPTAEFPPASWVVEFGEVEATRRFRVARSAWLNAKEAPVMLKLAKELVVGISKALATDTTGPKVINMQIVAMPQTQKREIYPVIDVEGEEVRR